MWVDDAQYRVAAERSASRTWEQRIAWCPGSFGEPGSQQRPSLPTRWCDPLLATFSVAAQVRSGAQVDGAAGQGGICRDVSMLYNVLMQPIPSVPPESSKYIDRPEYQNSD